MKGPKRMGCWPMGSWAAVRAVYAGTYGFWCVGWGGQSALGAVADELLLCKLLRTSVEILRLERECVGSGAQTGGLLMRGLTACWLLWMLVGLGGAHGLEWRVWPQGWAGGQRPRSGATALGLKSSDEVLWQDS